MNCALTRLNRKCGRVVCANCSPHRITIPRQYIVHPPIVDLSGDDEEDATDYTTNPALGGGEEVRVCNPCVPDPNYNPPPQVPRPDNWPPSQPTPFPNRQFYGSPSPAGPFPHPGNPVVPDDFTRMLPNYTGGPAPPQGHFGVPPHPERGGPHGSARPDIFRDGR